MYLSISVYIIDLPICHATMVDEAPCVSGFETVCIDPVSHCDVFDGGLVSIGCGMSEAAREPDPLIST